MAKKDVFTKILAIAGTVLVWIPIMTPVLFSLIAIFTARLFRFDFLMPAELFPVALIGGGALAWAALRTHSRQKLILWSLGITMGLLFGSQVIAVATGLATGEAEPTSGWRIVVLAAIILYSLMLILLGIGGVLMLQDLFKSPLTQPGDELI